MKYQCIDPSPQHLPFLEEIARLPSFNNLYLHLPGTRSWYEGIYASKVAKLGEDKISADTRVLPRLWRAIDDFIVQTDFDVEAFERQRKAGVSDPLVHDQAEILLAPLYIHVRKEGFSSERIIK